MLYGDSFYNYIEKGSKSAADAVIKTLFDYDLRPESVLDVGCGRGAWLERWEIFGVKNILGLDGAHVDQNKLLISSNCFQACDLSITFNLFERFDLVQCLELAEHLPSSRAEGLVKNLTDHGDIILFSAAVPGQGGENHLNEQPLEYWRKMFEAKEFTTVDLIRPSILNKKHIPPYYRFNALLFVKSELFIRMPENIQAFRVDPGRDLDDLSDLSWNIRLKLLKHIPISLITQLSIIHHRMRSLIKIGG